MRLVNLFMNRLNWGWEMSDYKLRLGTKVSTKTTFKDLRYGETFVWPGESATSFDNWRMKLGKDNYLVFYAFHINTLDETQFDLASEVEPICLRLQLEVKNED